MFCRCNMYIWLIYLVIGYGYVYIDLQGVLLFME